ncbi:MAG: reverse transcriptase domain-containing protein [Pseudomonadota bacterium]
MNAFNSTFSKLNLFRTWSENKAKFRKSCSGVDKVSGPDFETNLARSVSQIQERLDGQFKPKGLLAIAIEKPGKDEKRIICVPTIADRVIQLAVLDQLRPRLARMGVDNNISYGVARGSEKSVLGARKFACVERAKKPWVYKTDIRKFFDNIDRELLVGQLHRAVRQTSLAPAIVPFVHAELKEGFDPDWKQICSANGIVRGKGVRQGMPFSPFFAGLFLRDIDREIDAMDVSAARYVDDFVAFFASEREALAFHLWLKDRLSQISLEIGEPNAQGSKTQIYEPHEDADFLGLSICRVRGGKFKLLVSDEVKAKTLDKLAAFSEIEPLLGRGKSLTTMGSYFANVERGYVNAFAEAQNIDEFKTEIHAQLREVQKRILIELFGRRRLRRMAKRHRKFVGIDELLG